MAEDSLALPILCDLAWYGGTVNMKTQVINSSMFSRGLDCPFRL